MRIEKANLARFKNWNYTTDLMSLQEVYGRGLLPLVNKSIRLYTKNPVQVWSDAMAQVFGANTKGTGIKGLKYTYEVKGVPNYTTTIAADTVTSANFNLGRNNQEFTICLSEEIANTNDILWLQNEQKLLVKAQASHTSDGKYVYRVQLVTNAPATSYVDNAYVAAGRTVSLLTNLQPELSRVGYMQERNSLEKRVNYLTKVRVGREWTGEAAMADWIVYDMDSKTGKEVPIFWMSGLEKKMMEELYRAKENAIVWGESNVDPNTDKPLMQTGGDQSEVGISGDGIYQAIRREGMNEYYSNFSVSLLNDMVMSMKARNPYQDTKMKIMLMTGMRGYQLFDSAMRDVLKGSNILDGNWIYDKQGGKVNIGVDFGSYSYLGTEFTVVRNPVFDDMNQLGDELDNEGFPYRSSMFMALDMSTYDGTPNISLLNKDGVGVITNYTLGLGGKDGKTSGNFSTRVHGSAMDMVAYAGAVVHIPETCMILRKSKVVI